MRLKVAWRLRWLSCLCPQLPAHGLLAPTDRRVNSISGATTPVFAKYGDYEWAVNAQRAFLAANTRRAIFRNFFRTFKIFSIFEIASICEIAAIFAGARIFTIVTQSSFFCCPNNCPVPLSSKRDAGSSKRAAQRAAGGSTGGQPCVGWTEMELRPLALETPAQAAGAVAGARLLNRQH
jgi:hypothetical protein